MIKFLGSKLLIECSYIADKLYFNCMNNSIEINYIDGAYIFDFNENEKYIFEHIYFQKEKLKCTISEDIEGKRLLNITDDLYTIESDNGKYIVVIFKGNDNVSHIHIDFSENYKRKLLEISDKTLEQLDNTKVIASSIKYSNDKYNMSLVCENKDGEKVNINKFISDFTNEEVPYRLQIVYDNCKQNTSHAYDIELDDFKYDYISNIDEVCKYVDEIAMEESAEKESVTAESTTEETITEETTTETNTVNESSIEENVKVDESITEESTIEEITIEKGTTYDLYLSVVMYQREKRIRITSPNIDNELAAEQVSISSTGLNNYKVSMYYDSDNGISFNIDTLKLKASVEDIKLEAKQIILTTSIHFDSENQPLLLNDLIDDVSLVVLKRTSSLNITLRDYKIVDNNIIMYINNERMIDGLTLGLWDLFVDLKIKSVGNLVRIKNYTDVPNKKETLIFPYLYNSKVNRSIKPYYTLDDELSFEVNEKLSINRVNHLKLENGKIEIRGAMKLFQGMDISTLSKDISLFFIAENLDRTEIKAKFIIINNQNNLCNFKIITDNIDNWDTDEFKNSIYTKKIAVTLEIDHQLYNLGVNVDYSKIIIEKIDSDIRNKNYKLKSKLLYKIMCRLLPIKKNLVMFQSFGGRSYSGNPKYVYEYAKDNHKKLKFVWALRNQFEHVPGPVIKVKLESLKYYYYLARAEYIVSNLNMQNGVRKRKGAKFIQTWHGTPLKRISFDVNKNSPAYDAKFLRGFAKRVRKWDYLLAQNTFSKEAFRSAFRYKGHIDVIGHPLNDILVKNDSEKINEIKTNLKIDKNKKVILYAPTWRDNSRYILDLDIEKLYEKLHDEYVLLIKTHYFVNTSLEVNKFDGFVYDVSKYEDIQELSLISDVLITDYSSVMFDFAATKKPMVFYCHDLEYYKGKLRGFYFDFEEEAPGPIVKTSEEIADVIANIEEIHLSYKDKYNKFHERFAYLEDGTSSKRACASIFNLGKKKKKIYFLSFNVFGMGGTGRTVINTAESLIEHGYDVELISVLGDKNDQYFDINEDIKVSLLVDKSKKKTRLERVLNARPSILIDKDDEFYSSFSLLTDFKIVKKLIKLRKAILVSTRPGFNIMLTKYFKLRRFKVIGQEHLNFNIHPKNLQKQIKKYYKKLDLLMTLTEADTVGYIKEVPECKNKIVKVPNAVPTLEHSEIVEKKKQIIAAGRLVPQKGFDLLIKTAPKIIEKHPDWVIKIFGKGRDHEYLRDLIIENGVEKNVFLMGPSKKIEKEMQESEIYVLSSRYEGFGMVIVEAMDVRLPVVSFDCPEGPREIITNEKDGILVETENLDELANQINRLIEDRELRESLAVNAKQSVVRFSPANITTIWIENLDI